MNLASEILKENSRFNVNRVVKIVVENPALIKELIELTLSKNITIQLRASWILTNCYEALQEYFAPNIGMLIEALPGFIHTGARRNILRIFRFEPVPEQYQVFLFDHCLQWLISKKEPIAVKAFAMDVLTNIAMKEPDLKNEIIPVILDIMPNGSAGIYSRGKKVLKKLGYNNYL
jgi:hypothetical protein